MMAKCDKCGYVMSTLDPGAKPVFGFVLNDGKQINACYDCIVHYGELSKEAETDPEAKDELKHFFDGIGGGTEQ